MVPIQPTIHQTTTSEIVSTNWKNHKFELLSSVTIGAISTYGAVSALIACNFAAWVFAAAALSVVALTYFALVLFSKDEFHAKPIPPEVVEPITPPPVPKITETPPTPVAAIVAPQPVAVEIPPQPAAVIVPQPVIAAPLAEPIVIPAPPPAVQEAPPEAAEEAPVEERALEAEALQRARLNFSQTMQATGIIALTCLSLWYAMSYHSNPTTIPNVFQKSVL